MEVWRNIKGYRDKYQISNYGRVRNLNKILAPINRKDGYVGIRLCLNGKHKSFLIHRLVALSFVRNINGEKEVNHIDSNRNNNNVNNLEWCNKSNNMKHAFSNGFASRAGSKNSQSKLSEKQVRIIKHIFTISNHTSIKKIAEIFKVGLTTIYEIRSGAAWKNVLI